MRRHSFATGRLILCAFLLTSSAVAQEVRVSLGKHATALPKACESVVPASINGIVDTPALVKEAICKGSGDMMIEYTYSLTVEQRMNEKGGQVSVAATDYEVYVPTLKEGGQGQGILLITSRNGTPVPSAELEKERQEAAQRLEKEENRTARQNSKESKPGKVTGMTPLGMYSSLRLSPDTFGRRPGPALDVRTFLTATTLTFLRREQITGREALVFGFRPRSFVKLNEAERYLTQLNGLIWIDAQDRIVCKLVAWPDGFNRAESVSSNPSSEDERLAVYFEMTRLVDGVWLPRLERLNGAEYPSLFPQAQYDSVIVYTGYKRFTTATVDAKEVKVVKPKQERR